MSTTSAYWWGVTLLVAPKSVGFVNVTGGWLGQESLRKHVFTSWVFEVTRSPARLRGDDFVNACLRRNFSLLPAA
jgi:hypothetical protein